MLHCGKGAGRHEGAVVLTVGPKPPEQVHNTPNRQKIAARKRILIIGIITQICSCAYNCLPSKDYTLFSSMDGPFIKPSLRL